MKCICQMCACGKHRCPHFVQKHQTVTSKEPCKITEYRGEFQKTAHQNIMLHKPADCIKPQGEVDFDTTNQTTYPSYNIQQSPRKVNPPDTKHVECSEPMQAGTEYSQNYLKGRGEVVATASYLKKKTQPYGGGDGPLVNSVTRTDFDKKKVADKPKIHKLKDNHLPSNAPFESKSVQQADYTPFKEPPRKTGRRPDNISTKGEALCFDTTTRSHYTRYSGKAVAEKPLRDVYVYEPNPNPFDGSSIMKADYGVHKAPVKSTLVKHDNGLFASDDPMPHKTTNLAAYPNWGVQKAVLVKEPAVYRPPSQDMQLQKTSDDYKNFGRTPPSKALRPKTNIAFGGDFDGVSMYTNGFVKHEVSGRTKPIMSREQTYYSSGVPFEGTSESKHHYKKHQVAPAKMVRRINQVFNKDAPFDDHTSYKDQYNSKKLPECPVLKSINTNFTGYHVVDDIEGGHRFLEKMNSSSTGSASPLPPIVDRSIALVAVN